MPAPKNPSTAKATQAVIRRGDETAARRLRDHNWRVTPPEYVPDPEPMRREAEQSLWLHLAIAGHLVQHPEQTLALAKDNLARWRAKAETTGDHSTSLWDDRWQHVLDGGVEMVLAVITGVGEESIELRQNSPFAGVLGQEERMTILKSHRQHRGVAA